MVTQLQPDVRAYLHGGEVIKRYIRGVDEVKQEAAHKEVSKVREDKAR